ncbi:hypothetical protein AMTR_s00076p00121030 [Amborella trichopoda]|uniref:Aminotransferase-like plant mobile domain-containing protein n=1 Tax=Amborella trichopoda TaxID=13333 RepID=W1PAI7_AMBTC|nr:hypothetical protein AMTR_s00076p00121030 [Amborella trichopoda]
MIEDELEVFRQEVDLTIDHGPLSDSEIHSLQAFLVYLFGEFLFADRYKGRAHLSVIWMTRQLDYLERVAWGLAIVGLLHHHLCSVARGASYLGGCSILLQVWAWEHITIPRPLPGRLAPSFPTIHCWSYGVWDSKRIPSLLYYLLLLDITSLRAERDSAVDERESIAEDFEHLRQIFDRMVTERDSMRDELERV